MLLYYDKVIKGTDHEDALVILQFLTKMIGQRFTFLNYFKEIPVSYEATLLSVENEMAEFEVHEYQAKVISLEKKALIHCHEKCPFPEDIIGEVFYINIERSKVILCKLGYASIRSEMRRFVRVLLDRPIEATLTVGEIELTGNVKDISLGGAAMSVSSEEHLNPGSDLDVALKLPDLFSGAIVTASLSATVAKVSGDAAPYTCIIEFHPGKLSQQQIFQFINQRQVEIIKELKVLNI